MATNEDGRQPVQYGDQQVERGAGGETHQVAADGAPRLTTQQGTVVSDDQNTLRAGERGPGVLEDFHFREKIFHFDHEQIPERVVHARGYGAHGYFENYEPLTEITRADPFCEAGLRTPVFVRFSTVAGNKGSTDLARDVRGFATKFYTREGNWDLVGNNIPVFFIQDAIKFPDIIHAAKQEPDRGFPQAQTAHDNFWDFVSLLPESAHMLMWIMSDRAIPRSFRFMEGFGVHTFRLVNAEGRSTFVKFHWKPKLGLQSVVWNEALKISGADPDFHRRDLWDAITAGDFPEWELGLQLFDDDFAGELRRPLQPGAAVLRQPERGGAAAYHRRVRLRAEQVRPGGHPDQDGGRAAQRRRRPGRPGGRGPGAARAARPAARRPGTRPRPASLPALSILANGPDSFAGRKIGILVTSGIDVGKLAEVKSAAEQEGVNVELVAPTVGGIEAGDGNRMPADQKIDGAPSVLYDAVIVLAAKSGATALAAMPTARDFVTDAYAHCKFIGYAGEPGPLFEAAGLSNLMDDGFICLDEHSAADFVSRCGQLRFWARQEGMVKAAVG